MEWLKSFDWSPVFKLSMLTLISRTDAKSDELQPATKQIEKITKETSR